VKCLSVKIGVGEMALDKKFVSEMAVGKMRIGVLKCPGEHAPGFAELGGSFSCSCSIDCCRHCRFYSTLFGKTKKNIKLLIST